MTYEVVDTDAGFAEVVAELALEERYALDTEFHRERTYFPKLALLQLAWRERVVVVDPLEVDVAPLSAVLDTDAVAVLHAGDQDLEVLDRACGRSPRRLFDTQVGAGFVGMSSPSLGTLHDKFLGKKLPKGDRLTNWLARPLSDAQLHYAASDVADLLEIHGLLIADLRERGRLSWAETECDEMLARDRGAREPAEAWRRIKEVRQLRGRKLATAQALAAWREERAVASDLPPRFVLPDLALVGIAQSSPQSVEKLRKVRGVDGRSLKGRVADDILGIVADARNSEPGHPPDDRDNTIDRKLRPAVTLVSAWVSQLGRDLSLDSTLLATRADIEALLAGDPSARLGSGWRAEVVGDAIRRLVAGELALAFDGKGGLVVEERTAMPPSGSGSTS